jgi:hypothetical protein
MIQVLRLLAKYPTACSDPHRYLMMRLRYSEHYLTQLASFALYIDHDFPCHASDIMHFSLPWHETVPTLCVLFLSLFVHSPVYIALHRNHGNKFPNPDNDEYHADGMGNKKLNAPMYFRLS